MIDDNDEKIKTAAANGGDKLMPEMAKKDTKPNVSGPQQELPRPKQDRCKEGRCPHGHYCSRRRHDSRSEHQYTGCPVCSQIADGDIEHVKQTSISSTLSQGSSTPKNADNSFPPKLPTVTGTTKAIVLFTLVGIYIYAGVQRRADVKDLMMMERKKSSWQQLPIKTSICTAPDHNFLKDNIRHGTKQIGAGVSLSTRGKALNEGLHAEGFRLIRQKFEQSCGPGMIPPCQRCYNSRPLRVPCRRCNVTKLCGQCLGHLCSQCEMEAHYEQHYANESPVL